jgi:hypothetical protein
MFIGDVSDPFSPPTTGIYNNLTFSPYNTSLKVLILIMVFYLLLN